ncbi:hypothetical protein E2C01_028972 [Portunus trituberculatus]|uniref:Uncharacterized protein n=1 Tax=Portunus trituberculatus TaxID=210409 RepID=A0A5B7EQL0_PORTR|nr:hypothetical protein [Portunus trituberculatus]
MRDSQRPHNLHVNLDTFPVRSFTSRRTLPPTLFLVPSQRTMHSSTFRATTLPYLPHLATPSYTQLHPAPLIYTQYLSLTITSSDFHIPAPSNHLPSPPRIPAPSFFPPSLQRPLIDPTCPEPAITPPRPLRLAETWIVNPCKEGEEEKFVFFYGAERRLIFRLSS